MAFSGDRFSCILYRRSEILSAKRLPKDTLSVFIISCDTLNKYGYDVVAKENRILVRYDLSIPDLERMNYNIPYPPALWMKETKMFPSYDEVINRYK
ncbi:MAG: hypothetical protein K5854_04030 [Prevotella sp.]|jgi:hypothetical protein|nr:hypothetical protein [Prevotella sp.]